MAFWIGKSARCLLVLLASMVIFSCAPILAVPPADLTSAPLDPRWEKLSGRQQFAGALRAMADIDLFTAASRRHLRVALLLQLPAQMHMESIPVFGPPDFFLSLSREKLSIFLPGEKKYYLGRPSRENLSHFLPVSLSPAEMVSVLLGGILPLTSEAGIGYRESGDNDKRRLDLFKNDQIIRTFWADGNVERLTDLEIADRDLEIAYRVHYDKFLRQGDRDWPQQVTIVSPDESSRIIVRYDDVELSVPESEDAFDFPTPVDIMPTRLD